MEMVASHLVKAIYIYYGKRYFAKAVKKPKIIIISYPNLHYLIMSFPCLPFQKSNVTSGIKMGFLQKLGKVHDTSATFTSDHSDHSEMGSWMFGKARKS